MQRRLIALLPLAACAAPPAQPSLSGTNWRLLAAEEPAPTLQFTTGSQGLSGAGFSGCNQFMGRVVSGPDGALRFMGVAGTMMVCDPGSDAQEARVLQGLNNVRRIRLAADRLEMLGHDGALLLTWGRG
jgi:heat shock protein HslJ